MLVPLILVFEVVIPPVTIGIFVLGFAKLVPEVNEVNEVAGKVDGQYIVKSGLKAGEKIATNNIDMLNEGVVVKAVIK